MYGDIPACQLRRKMLSTRSRFCPGIEARPKQHRAEQYAPWSPNFFRCASAFPRKPPISTRRSGCMETVDRKLGPLLVGSSHCIRSYGRARHSVRAVFSFVYTGNVSCVSLVGCIHSFVRSCKCVSLTMKAAQQRRTPKRFAQKRERANAARQRVRALRPIAALSLIAF